jgi:hypothetical protein
MDGVGGKTSGVIISPALLVPVRVFGFSSTYVYRSLRHRRYSLPKHITFSYIPSCSTVAVFSCAKRFCF